MKNLLVAFLCVFSQSLFSETQETSFNPPVYSEDSMIKLKEMLPRNPFMIPKEHVDVMLQTCSLTVEDLLIQLIPVAQSFARPPISNYHVGAAALGQSGNIYLGVNLEFLGLPLNEAVHGEQFLIAHARNHGETEIIAMALSAAPCGHCRQFLHEMDENGRLQIIMPDTLSTPLSAFLPKPFGPKDLNLPGNLLVQPVNYPSFSDETPLIEQALHAAIASYSPYSHSRSGVAIQTKDGRIYKGSYLENAAFNPSLSPLQAALVVLVTDLRAFDEISEVVLVEHIEAKISHKGSIQALLKHIAPSSNFKLENREF